MLDSRVCIPERASQAACRQTSRHTTNTCNRRWFRLHGPCSGKVKVVSFAPETHFISALSDGIVFTLCAMMRCKSWDYDITVMEFPGFLPFLCSACHFHSATKFYWHYGFKSPWGLGWEWLHWWGFQASWAVWHTAWSLQQYRILEIHILVNRSDTKCWWWDSHVYLKLYGVCIKFCNNEVFNMLRSTIFFWTLCK